MTGWGEALGSSWPWWLYAPHSKTVECTDEALTEALFVGLPAVKVDEAIVAALAEALCAASTR